MLLVFTNDLRIILGSKLQKVKNIEARKNLGIFIKRVLLNINGNPNIACFMPLVV